MSGNVPGAVVIGLTVMTFALAGCASQEEGGNRAAQPPDRPATSTPPTAAASTSPSQTATVAGNQTNAATNVGTGGGKIGGGSGGGACTPDGATLLAALKANSALYSDLNSPYAITPAECEAGYVIGLTSAPGTDTAGVLYRYDSSTRSWKALKGGTAFTCEEVPAAVAAHLSRCIRAE